MNMLDQSCVRALLIMTATGYEENKKYGLTPLFLQLLKDVSMSDVQNMSSSVKLRYHQFCFLHLKKRA